MTRKEQILLLLEEQQGEAISGQEIADKLSVTRAGVWKAIKLLQKEGYAIEAVPNKGYTLKKSADVLSAAHIRQKLSERGTELFVKVEKEVVSTNTSLRQYAEQGEKRDMLLLAEHQSGGKGRKGRSFYSPEGSGLYMSLLLHPEMPAHEGTLITTMTAAAVALALEHVSGQQVQIKWVNDVLVRGKKVVGILTEGSSSMEEGRFEYVIVGIGINVYEPSGGFPPEVSQVAGAVFSGDVCRENLRNRIAVEVVNEFMKYYRSFQEKAFLEDYRSRSYLIGQRVRIIPTERITAEGASLQEDESFSTATVLGIDDECHLVVQYEDGRQETLSNGEVSVRESFQLR